MAFKLGTSPGMGSKAVKPKAAPTLAELAAYVDAARLTADEARHLAFHVLLSPSRWQKPPERTDRRLYRPPTEAEVAEVEVLS